MLIMDFFIWYHCLTVFSVISMGILQWNIHMFSLSVLRSWPLCNIACTCVHYEINGTREITRTYHLFVLHALPGKYSCNYLIQMQMLKVNTVL